MAKAVARVVSRPLSAAYRCFDWLCIDAKRTMAQICIERSRRG